MVTIIEIYSVTPANRRQRGDARRRARRLEAPGGILPYFRLFFTIEKGY
jgi:hypothetical protein